MSAVPTGASGLPIGTGSTARLGVDLLVDGLRADGADLSPAALMRLIVAAALAGLPGATDAGLTVQIGKRFMTAAATGGVPIRVNALQYEYGGPCLAALCGGEPTVHVQDLCTDARWPEFGSAATARTPVRSLLSHRLYVGEDQPIGSLNVYACRPHAFDADTVRAGERLAACAALALAHAHAQDIAANLVRAIDSNRDVGVAIGILMTRRTLTRDQAFDLLDTTSQRRHRKLRDLAVDVAEWGELPPEPTAPTAPTAPQE